MNEINDLIEEFPVENISCENNFIKEEDKENYTIIIYQNNNCQDFSANKPIVIFGDCYNEIKKINNISESYELIVSKIDSKIDENTYYSFYDPNTLEKLDSTPCHNQSIIEEEDLNKKINDKMEDSKEALILNLISQGINVFNISDPFYTDICYHYESPNGKDVPIKARLTAFFPNITLCDEGCSILGIDIVTMKAKCECKFRDLVNMELISDNLYGQAIQEIIEIISELNIAVVKCFKDIFNPKFFVKNEGGFIIIALFIGQVACLIKYAIDGLYFIRKYIFNLTNSYLNFIGEKNIFKNNLFIPPKKKRGSTKSIVLDGNKSSSCSRNILVNNNLHTSSKKKMFDFIEKSQRKSNIDSQKNYFLARKKLINLKNLKQQKNKKMELFIKIKKKNQQI